MRIKNVVKKYEGFGLTCIEKFEKKEEGRKFAFFQVGDTQIEFVSFSPDKGWDPVHTVIRAQEGALNHLCFEVDDLDVSIKDFEKNGAKLLEGCPMAGAHGRMAFFDPKTTENILLELCEA